MKKLIFVLIIMLSSHSFAQSFFDTDAFSLKGDVSSCVVVTTGLFLHNKGVFEFDINKNLIKAQYKYPNSDFTMVEAVRIADALIVTLKNGCRYQYIIDEDRKLRFERYLINGKYSSISGYSYEKEEIKKGISYIPSSLESVYLPENFDLSDISDSRIRRSYFEYTDYKYDSKGNWISRTRVMDGDKYKEERTIKYWSSSTSTSANSSVKAVFHGTRVGKVYHIPEDSRDDYDLFFQCNVTVYNIKGQQVQLTAYVDGPTRGKGLYAPNGRHKTSEGNVAIGGVLNSRTDSDNTRWPHYTLTLPFSDLCLPDGTHTINVRWFAQAQGKFIGNSEFQTIHFTKHGKEITNFYVDGGEETPGF